MLTDTQKLELIKTLLDVIFDKGQVIVAREAATPEGELALADALIELYASGYEAIDIALNA